MQKRSLILAKNWQHHVLAVPFAYFGLSNFYKFFFNNIFNGEVFEFLHQRIINNALFSVFLHFKQFLLYRVHLAHLPC